MKKKEVQVFRRMACNKIIKNKKPFLTVVLESLQFTKGVSQFAEILKGEEIVEEKDNGTYFLILYV